MTEATCRLCKRRLDNPFDKNSRSFGDLCEVCAYEIDEDDLARWSDNGGSYYEPSQG